MSRPTPSSSNEPPHKWTSLGPCPRVCRLGLASRGNTDLAAEDVHLALDRGVNYLNWCGTLNGMREAIAELGPRRHSVVIAVQLEARSARGAADEIRRALRDLRTDYLDAVTYYYVESREEWNEISSPGGAAETLEAAKATGTVRMIGLTTHQRPLAAALAQTGRLDLLMIRYNAAHRGAERDIFPTTDRLRLPIVAFTALRWGALLHLTPDDPPSFTPPSAADCYRFALAHPSVSVVLAAPNTRAELLEDLSVLADWRPLPPDRLAALTSHGERVRRHAGPFP